MSDKRREADRRVPSLPPLDGVKDPATRAVLEALAQGWQVRNGQAATTDDYRFITKADLKQWINEGSIMAGGKFGSGTLGGSGGAPGADTPIQQWVNNLVQQAVDVVQNSEFFQFLGRRIDAIGPPLAQLGDKANQMTTLIRNETQNRSNSDNAFISTLNQVFGGIAATDRPVWAMKTDGVTVQVTNAAAFATSFTNMTAQVGRNTSAIEQETTNRVTADGQLFSRWSVKIDQNGYVSGFGLSSTANNSTPLSEFYIRADRFAIGSPGVPRTIIRYDTAPDGSKIPVYADAAPANIPFVVFTTAQTVNGQTSPPGVYMTDAFIRNGAIGHAQIGLAEIDTLLLGGNVLTIPQYALAGNTTLVGDVPSTLVTLVVTFPPGNFRNGTATYPTVPLRPPGVVVVGSFFMNNSTTSHDLSGVQFRLMKGGVTMTSGAFSVQQGCSYTCTLVAVDTSPDITNSYSMTAWTDGAHPFSAFAADVAIFAMGAQR